MEITQIVLENLQEIQVYFENQRDDCIAHALINCDDKSISGVFNHSSLGNKIPHLECETLYYFEYNLNNQNSSGMALIKQVDLLRDLGNINNFSKIRTKRIYCSIDSTLYENLTLNVKNTK